MIERKIETKEIVTLESYYLEPKKDEVLFKLSEQLWVGYTPKLPILSRKWNFRLILNIFELGIKVGCKIFTLDELKDLKMILEKGPIKKKVILHREYGEFIHGQDDSDDDDESDPELIEESENFYISTDREAFSKKRYLIREVETLKEISFQGDYIHYGRERICRKEDKLELLQELDYILNLAIVVQEELTRQTLNKVKPVYRDEIDPTQC